MAMAAMISVILGYFLLMAAGGAASQFDPNETYELDLWNELTLV